MNNDNKNLIKYKAYLLVLFFVLFSAQLFAADFTVESASFTTTTKGLSGQLFANNTALDFTVSNWEYLRILSNANFSPASSLSALASTGQPKLLTSPLVYPNPFQLANGSELGYRLDIDSDRDLEIRVYDMRANQIARKILVAGTQGTLGNTYNKVKISAADFNNFQLSSGVYFFVIIYGNKTVLAKGKFAIVP